MVLREKRLLEEMQKCVFLRTCVIHVSEKKEEQNKTM